MRIVAVAALLSLVGCEALTDPCAHRMDATRTEWGAPEEVNTFTASGYNNVDWWYWTQGRQRSFTWGRHVSGCEVSTYTFTPIP